MSQPSMGSDRSE